MKNRATFRGVVLRDTSPARSVRPAPRTAAARAPAEWRVRVAREVAGRGGKAVSVITGLELAEGQLAELATRLKKMCGAGGSVRNGTIEIQGEHRDRLVAELCKLGYQARRSGG